MDTKYFRQAFEEYVNEMERKFGPLYPGPTLGEVPLRDLSDILRRAQELKDRDKGKS